MAGIARKVSLGALCAAGSVFLFASFTVGSRFGLSHGFAVADLALLRFGVASALLLPVFWRKGLAGLSLARALALAGTGGLGFALLAYEGFSRAPSSHAAVLLHGALPVFGMLSGAFLLGERPSGRRIAGGALIVLGMTAILASGAGREGIACGHALLLCASAAWTTYGALLARWRIKAVDAVAIVGSLSFLALGLYAIATGHVVQAVPAAGFGMQVLFQGVLIGALSLFLYSKAVELLGATTVALAGTAVPVLTVLAGIPLLAEVPSAAEWAGVALAIGGMAAALAPERGRASP